MSVRPGADEQRKRRNRGNQQSDTYFHRILLPSLLIVAVLAAILIAPAHSYGRHDALDATASWIAGRPVTVRCLTVKEGQLDLAILYGASAYVDGWTDKQLVWHPHGYTVFAPGLCEILIALKRGEAGEYAVADVALALLILTHEAMHLRGAWWSGDEALTEAQALRHFRYAAWRFGVPEPAATMLLYEAVQNHNALPPDYLAEFCATPSVEQGKLVGCDWAPVR